MPFLKNKPVNTHIVPFAQTSSWVAICIMCPGTVLHYGIAEAYTSQ